MADNAEVDSGTGVNVATDEIAGAHYQRVKLSQGADGSATDVSSAAPLQVTVANTGANATPIVVDLGANNDVTVTGTVTVDLGVNNDVTVTGSVTANAGTNLNTSTLALEAGGNLAGAATSLAAIDDWDESDRAKVNPIVGQAGVQGGGGAVSATTQRVTIGTDDSAVLSLGVIENTVCVDDGGFVPGTTRVQMVGFEFDDVAPDSVNEGDAGAARMSANRNIYTTLRDAAGNERGANVDASGQLAVAGPVTNAGTFAVQVDGSALTALQLIDNPVAVLGTATYTEASSSGFIMGAVRRDADTTLVNTTNEIAPLQVDANGYLKVEIFDGGGTHTVDIASGGVASGAIASGAVASGAVASGAFASGSIASGAIASGAIAAGAIAAGATSIADNEDVASASADRGVKMLAVQQATPANTADTDGDYEFLKQSIGHLWVAPPPVTKVSFNFNRPANTTAYAANDALNDNATGGGGSSTELSWAIGRSAGVLRRVRIKKSDQTVATPTLRLWLYDTVFASGAGDNEAFVHPATDSIGFIDVPVTTAGTDDAVGWADCDIPFTGATLYGQIQTLSAFTPASGETFTIGLWYLPG